MKLLLSAVLMIVISTALNGQPKPHSYRYDGIVPIAGAGQDAADSLARKLRLAPGHHSIRTVEWGSGKAVGATTEVDVPVHASGKLSAPVPYLRDSLKVGGAAVLKRGGAVDLVLASAGAVTVLENDGAGNFGNPQIMAGPADPSAMVVTDLNGDGLSDVALAGDGSVWIYLNAGDGTFGAVQKVATGDGTVGLAAADFNGDGIPDLAVANRYSSDVRLLAGDGTSSFRQVAAIPVAADPRALVVGDWNRDGIADLAVASFGSAELDILTGSGDGTFRVAAIPMAAGSVALATGDLNGDGYVDLAVLNPKNETVSILWNMGSGFQVGEAISIAAGSRALAIGDIDGDGKPDLLVGGDQVQIPNGKILLDSNFTHSMVLSDFSNSGAVELAALTDGGAQVMLHPSKPRPQSLTQSRIQSQAQAATKLTAKTASPTITVTSGSDSGAGSLRQAIQDIASGGTITVTAGEIILQSPLWVTTAMTITGPASGPQPALISSSHQQLMIITANVTLNNLEFAQGTAQGGNGGNGYPSGGGGAGMGGALFIDAPNVTITNCYFGQNQAIGGDGGKGTEEYDESGPPPGTFLPRSFGAAGQGASDALASYGAAQPAACYDTVCDSGLGGGINGVYGGRPDQEGPKFIEIYEDGCYVNGILIDGTCTQQVGYFEQGWAGGGGGGAGLGGAIFVRSGLTTIANSQFSGNSATGGRWLGNTAMPNLYNPVFNVSLPNPHFGADGQPTCAPGIGIGNEGGQMISIDTVLALSPLSPWSSLASLLGYLLDPAHPCWQEITGLPPGTNGEGKGGAIFAAPGAAVVSIGNAFNNNSASNAGSSDCSYNDTADLCGAIEAQRVLLSVAFSMSGTPRTSVNRAFPVTFNASLPPGTTVTFSAPSTGPLCTFGGAASVTVAADVNGNVNPGTCTANGVSGTFQVTVSVPQQTPVVYCPSGQCALYASSGSQTFSLTIVPSPSITLSASANTSFLGSTVTLTATLGSASATGSVLFLQDVTPLGVARVVNGIATLHTSMLVAGNSPLVARYTGDANFGISTSAPLAHTLKTNYGPTFDRVTKGSVSYEQAAIGDFNGDGFADIAAVYQGSGTGGYVSVFLGIRGGVSSTPVNYPAGLEPDSVAIGDFNNDGNLDLAVADAGGGIAILLGNGKGAFGAPSILTHPAMSSVVVGDFDMDGNTDIAAITGGTSPKTTVSVWYGKGDGTFGAAVDYNSVSTNAQALVVADVNSLGYPDIVIANGNNGMDILGNNQNGGFQVVHFPDAIQTNAVATADMNGDGTPDMVLAGSTVEFVRGVAGAKVGVTGGYETVATALTWTAVQTADLYGNGGVNLLLAPQGQALIKVLTKKGDGTYSDIPFNTGTVPVSLAVADFNGDGATDVLTTGSSGLVILRSRRVLSSITPNPASFTASVSQPFSTPLSVTVTDVNGPAEGVTVTFTAPSSGPGVTFPHGNTAVTDASGVATITPTANSQAGAYTITASAPLLTPVATFNLTNVASVGIGVTMAHTGSFTQGQAAEWDIAVANTGSGSTTSGTTNVSDSLPTGYTLNNYSGAGWTCTSSGNNVGCTSTQAVAGGSAFPTLKLIVNVPPNSPASVSNSAKAWGGGDLTHTTSATAAVSNTDTVTVTQIPAQISINGNQMQSTAIQTAFGTLAVTLKDAGGAVIPSYASVVFTATTGGNGQSGTFSGNNSNTVSTQTNSSGIADPGGLIANTKTGSYSVGVAAGTATATFTLTNAGGLPANISITSGSGQSATVNTAFTNPLVATVTDAGLNPVAGATVTFSAPAQSGPSVTFAGGVSTATTNASGVATAAIVSANANAGGPYNVTASVNGHSVNFVLTNLAQQFQLTTQVSPAGAGTISPSSEIVSGGTMAMIQATANAGWAFTGFTGALTGTTNPQNLTVNAADMVTANFAPASTSLGGGIGAKSGPQNARVWPITIGNNGPGVALGAEITSITLTHFAGPACTPVVITPMPALSGGIITPKGSAVISVTIDFTGCAANSSFQATVTLSANTGAATGSITGLQLQ